MGLLRQAASVLQMLGKKSSPAHVPRMVQKRQVSLLCNTRFAVKVSHPVTRSQPIKLFQNSSQLMSPAYHLHHQSQPIESAKLDASGKRCHLTWQDGFQSEFHSVWLRHNCHCDECQHPNGQKLMDATHVSCSQRIDSLSVQGDLMMVTWRGHDSIHQGHLPFSFLRQYNYSPETLLERRLAVKSQPPSEIPTMNYTDITKSKESLLEWLQHVNEAGLCLVQGVPREDGMVLKVAQLIGPVFTSIYGTMFDVEIKPNPINVAYSDLGIDLHQDLVYFESPPGLQLLHCLEFDECVEGGENTFLDIFDVVDKFRSVYPDLFDTLTRVPATFQKIHYDRDLPVHIVNQKPHIKLNHLGEVCAVYWAPPFEGPLAVDGADVEKYFLAYETFAKTLKASKMMKHKLRPGELIIFNNLRTLHGRAPFKANEGFRKLQGCYVNIDILKSETQVANNLTGDGRLAKRVGNQCWF